MTGSSEEASQEGRFSPLAIQPVLAPGGMLATRVQEGDSTPLRAPVAVNAQCIQRGGVIFKKVIYCHRRIRKDRGMQIFDRSYHQNETKRQMTHTVLPRKRSLADLGGR